MMKKRRENYGNRTSPNRSNFKIPAGEELSTAETCEFYHREIPALSKGEFLNWRSAIIVQKVQNKLTNVIIWLTVVLVILTGIQIYKIFEK